MRRIQEETRNQIIRLRVAKRLSLSQISGATGVGRSTAARVLKDYPLSNQERKQIWSLQVKGRKRVAGRWIPGPDLSNRKFGRLLVLDRVARRKYQRWECLCECGEKTTVRTYNLVHGLTRSCGCFARDNAREREQKAPDDVNAHSIFLSYKITAKKRGMAFELSEDRCKALFKSNCFYCGANPLGKRMVHKNQEAPNRKSPYLFNGIDRKDNKAGYLEENCVPCCAQCNYAKGNMPLEKFSGWLDTVTKYRNMEGR